MSRTLLIGVAYLLLLTVRCLADEFPQAALDAWRKDRLSILDATGLSPHSFSATRTQETNRVIVRSGTREETKPAHEVQFYAKHNDNLVVSVTSRDTETRHIFKDGTFHIIRRRTGSEQWLLIDQGEYDLTAGKTAGDDPFWAKATDIHNHLSVMWLNNGQTPDTHAKTLNGFEVTSTPEELIILTVPGDYPSNPRLGTTRAFIPDEEYRLDSITSSYVHNGEEVSRFVIKFSDVSPDYLTHTATETGSGSDEDVVVERHIVTTVQIDPADPDPEIFDLAHYNIVIRELANDGSGSRWTYPLLIGFGVLMIGLSIWLKRKG